MSHELSLPLIIVSVSLTGKQSKKKPWTWYVDSPVEQNQMRRSVEREGKQRLCSVKKQLSAEELLLELRAFSVRTRKVTSRTATLMGGMYCKDQQFI